VCQTYLMYIPFGNSSQWVPLAMCSWADNVAGAVNNQGTIVLSSPPTLVKGTGFQGWTTEPQWRAVVSGDNLMTPP
jgi:hypothetical protein